MAKKEMSGSASGCERYFMLFDLCCALFAGRLALTRPRGTA